MHGWIAMEGKENESEQKMTIESSNNRCPSCLCIGGHNRSCTLFLHHAYTAAPDMVDDVARAIADVEDDNYVVSRHYDMAKAAIAAMGEWHSADSSLKGTAKSMPCESASPTNMQDARKGEETHKFGASAPIELSPSQLGDACNIESCAKALENAALILANFKPEGDRDKLEEWQACYAMLFKQMNDLVNAKREPVKVSVRDIGHQMYGKIEGYPPIDCMCSGKEKPDDPACRCVMAKVYLCTKAVIDSLKDRGVEFTYD